MPNRWKLLLNGGVLLGLVACAAPADVPAPGPAAAAAAADGRASGAETISPEDVHRRVSFLASDELRGRDTPSPGLEMAAEYLAGEYRRLGLEPAGDRGTYIQRYPFASWALDASTVHFGTLVGGKDNRMLEYGADFYAAAAPVARRAPGDMNHGKLAFAGAWGEDGLPKGSYEGTVPMVLIPGAYDRDFRSAVTQARRAAQAAGAPALVVVTSPDFGPQAFREQAAMSRGTQRGVPGADRIAVYYLTYEAASGIAARAGVELRAATGALVPLNGIEAHFAAEAAMNDQNGAPNVVAILRGSDPRLREEYVVVSSHMDHVGVGRPVDGDSIYNGADDDASGTAGILEVAEAFASLPQRPKRSILFLNVSGEEKGLLGSRWYSDHPTVPLERIVANVNVDMIGRNAPDTVVVIGKEYSSLGQVVNAAGREHRELKLVVSDDIWPEERFFFRSDHFNFARKEIPALFFFTGVHEDYHLPSDEIEKLDTDKAARVSRLIYYTVQRIADDPQRPAWDPRGLAEVRALTR